MLKKTAVLMAAVMSMTSVCFAQNMVVEDRDLNKIVEFIMDNYMGDVSEDELINAAINGMTDILDEYSEYFYNEEISSFIREISSSSYTLGIVYKMNDDGYPLIIDVEDGNAAQKAGIQKGDIITAVEGEDIAGYDFQDITDMFFYGGIDAIELEVARDDETLNLTLKFEKEKIETVEVKQLKELLKSVDYETNDKVGYIAVTSVAEDTAEDFSNAVDKMINQGKTGLILDLRGNLGGSVEAAVAICRKVVPKGIIVRTKDKQGNEEKIMSELEKCPFDKIVVVTDSMTASAAEMITSAIQDSGAGTVVGSRTYGKGVIQQLIPVADMGILKMTTQEYFSRNSNKINHVGVIPDVVVDVPYFISTDDPIFGSKVKNALNYLDYKTGSNLSIQNSIGQFQEENGLPVTKELDKATVNKINLKIYNVMSSDDRTLKKAVNEITKEVE